MFLVNNYIVINEYPGRKRGECYDRKHAIETDYKKDLASGRIKSYLDFDNYFNPDLTLSAPFEKDESKANKIIEMALFQIGTRWMQRLKETFPDHEYTLVMYFDSENSEWFLDFFNGLHKVEDYNDSGRIDCIHYFS